VKALGFTMLTIQKHTWISFIKQVKEGEGRDRVSVHVSLLHHPYVTVCPPAPPLPDIAEWKANYQAPPKSPSHAHVNMTIRA